MDGDFWGRLRKASGWLVRKKLGLAATRFLGDIVRRPGCGTLVVVKGRTIGRISLR
jgi:hypothetical protein